MIYMGLMWVGIVMFFCSNLSEREHICLAFKCCGTILAVEGALLFIVTELSR